MIKNYLTILVRTIGQKKFYTAVNVLCLTVGITFAMLIGLFIKTELNVNQDLKDVNRLFLVENTFNGEVTNYNFFSPPPLAKVACDEFPGQFTGYYRFWERNITVSHGDNHFRIQSMIGDSTLLTMFGFKVINGTGKLFGMPDVIIITRDAAMKLFGKPEVAGENISISTEARGIREYRIAAVIENPTQKNSVTDLMRMDTKIFLSLKNAEDFLPGANADAWDNGIISHLKLSDKVSTAEAESTLNNLMNHQAPVAVRENRKLNLAPLSDYYLITNHGSVIKLILTLSVIIILIMSLAVTNFTNISIASSISRLKEVGVRKVIGGSRGDLILQFLMEAVLLAIVSGLLSVCFYEMIHPAFAELLNTRLPSLFDEPLNLLATIGMSVLLIGCLAGFYPAVFHSAAKPIDSLKGKSKSMQGTLSFSKVLVTIQFIITVFVMIAGVVLYRQTDFFLEGDLGYEKSNIIIVSSVPRWWDEKGFQKMDAAQNEFLQSTDVEAVSLSWGAPGFGIGGTLGNEIYKAGSSPDQGIRINVAVVDENFANVYGIDVLEGNFLSGIGRYQSGNITLNRMAAKNLNVKTGDKIKFDGDSVVYTLAGVVSDFNYESMHEPIKPVAFMHNRDAMSYRFFSFKMKPGDPASSLAAVERLWKNVFPDEAFTYHFADERLRELYVTELQMRKASAVASILMLIIVMTGLTGLVSLNVSKRSKEIGIRKILGASVQGILMMLMREYGRLMIIAIFIAVPLAVYASTAWLQTFAYHVDLSWWMFAGPGLALLALTSAIVCLQSASTASSNPLNSLRYE
jgi:putative ABC transport system permease protein